MDVQLVGGPDDGKYITVPDGSRSIQICINKDTSPFLSEESPIEPTEDVTYDIKVLDVVLTSNGYRAYWHQ